MNPITRQDILFHQSIVPWSAQHQVEQDLLLCRAMAALFDDSFLHYMKQEGTRTHRAEFIGILEEHLEDRGFCSDTESLLRNGISYNAQIAGKYVIENLLRRLPE